MWHVQAITSCLPQPLKTQKTFNKILRLSGRMPRPPCSSSPAIRTPSQRMSSGRRSCHKLVPIVPACRSRGRYFVGRNVLRIPPRTNDISSLVSLGFCLNAVMIIVRVSYTALSRIHTLDSRPSRNNTGPDRVGIWVIIMPGTKRWKVQILWPGTKGCVTNAINSSVMPEIVRVKRGSRIGIRMPNFLPSSGFRPPTWHLPCGRMDDKGRGRKGRRTAKKSVPIGRRRRRRPSSVLAQISNGMTDDHLSLSLSLSLPLSRSRPLSSSLLHSFFF